MQRLAETLEEKRTGGQLARRVCELERRRSEKHTTLRRTKSMKMLLSSSLSKNLTADLSALPAVVCGLSAHRCLASPPPKPQI
jgi:hypothetical protein